MVYFGENNDYILCECEICKREMYIEKQTIAEEDAYSYQTSMPVKCACGAIDEYINRAKKSCHSIRRELAHLSDLLHKQQNAANKMTEINAEINKKFNPPTFLQSLIGDIMFSLKVFLIMLGAAIGVEIFLFIISALMFFFGLAFQMPDLSRAGNELFYNVNVFKDRGGGILSKFGFSAEFAPLDTELAKEQIILDYIPYAVAGLIIIVFYVFLAVLIIKTSWDLAKLGFFATKVMNQKLKVIQKREEYIKELEELNFEMQNISEQIDSVTILAKDYKNIRATDAILRYFINNRIDTIREAVNLFHDEDFKNRQLEYSKAVYNETKQTRRYTKALYMLTSDENIKVDVREEFADSNPKPAESAKNLGKPFSKIKKPDTAALNVGGKRTDRLNAKNPNSSRSSQSENADKSDNHRKSWKPWKKEQNPVYAISSSSSKTESSDVLDDDIRKKTDEISLNDSGEISNNLNNLNDLKDLNNVFKQSGAILDTESDSEENNTEELGESAKSTRMAESFEKPEDKNEDDISDINEIFNDNNKDYT